MVLKDVYLCGIHFTQNSRVKILSGGSRWGRAQGEIHGGFVGICNALFHKHGNGYMST